MLNEIKFRSWFSWKFFPLIPQTFIYRGVQGFVEFTSFKLSSPVQKMVHYEMALASSDFRCPEHYLVLIVGKEVQFFKANTIGNCRASDDFKC